MKIRFVSLFLVWFVLRSTAAGQTDGEVGVRMIVVPTLAGAENLLGQIEAGTPFDALARFRSIDPSAARGGYLGVLEVADLGPALREGLSGLGDEDFAVADLGGEFAVLDLLNGSEVTWFQAMAEAGQLLGSGRWENARPLFQRALAIAEAWPGDTRLGRSLSGLATAFLREGRYDRAEPLFRRALAIHETVPIEGPNLDVIASLNDLAGTVYRRGGDLAEVESLFYRALQMSGEAFGESSVQAATARNNLGLVVRDLGKLDDAVALFSEALGILEGNLDPFHPSVQATLDALAEAHRLGGNLAQAEATSVRSLRIVERNSGLASPELARPLVRLANVVRDRGRVEEAIELHVRALAVRWHGGDDVVGVLQSFVEAMFAARAGEAESARALDELDSMLADAGEELHRAMGRIFLAAQFDREALFVMRRAVERFPESWLLDYALAEAFIEAQEFDEALATLEMVEPASDEENSLKLRRTGDVLASLSRYDDALAAYAAAIAANPENLTAWLARADLLLEVGEAPAAEASYDEVLLLDPENVQALAALADIYLLQGRVEEALDRARRSVALDDANRQARYTLAQAQLRLGQTSEGQESLARFQTLLESESERDRREREVTSIVSRASLLDLEEAAVVLAEGAARFPDATRISLDLGLVEMGLGNLDGAIRSLETRRDQGIAGDFLVQRSLEKAYLSVGREDEARAARLAFLETIGQALEAAAE